MGYTLSKIYFLLLKKFYLGVVIYIEYPKIFLSLSKLTIFFSIQQLFLNLFHGYLFENIKNWEKKSFIAFPNRRANPTIFSLFPYHFVLRKHFYLIFLSFKFILFKILNNF